MDRHGLMLCWGANRRWQELRSLSWRHLPVRMRSRWLPPSGVCATPVILRLGVGPSGRPKPSASWQPSALGLGSAGV